VSEQAKSARQRLESIKAELKLRFGENSRGVRDWSALPLSPGLLHDVEICIQSEEQLDIRTGFFALNGLMADRPISELPAKFHSMLVHRVEQLLCHPFAGVVYDAVDWFSQLRDSFPQYRERMLQFLTSRDIGLRRAAVRYYPTYARSGEVEPLLSFRDDGCAEEISPLGDWRYALRDQALELIEKQVNHKFPAPTLSEAYEGGKVTWRDWRPFLEWWLRNNPGRNR
jgi:hypothetical protein